MHHYKLRVKSTYKNQNLKKKKKITFSIVWPAGDSFITRPSFPSFKYNLLELYLGVQQINSYSFYNEEVNL